MSWIKLHRKIKDHWIYNSKQPMTKREAWFDILLTVNHTQKKVLIADRLLTCNAGESLLSVGSWAKQWRWNISAARRFLKLLENDSMIVLKSEQNTTRLTVCKWDTYQVKRTADEQQVNSKRTASEQQVNTTKEGKESKEVKNGKKKEDFIEIIFPFDSENFKIKWLIWKQYKKEEHKFSYKSPISEQAALKKLRNIAASETKAIELIDEAIANGWKGFFKTNTNGNSTTKNGGHLVSRDTLESAYRELEEEYNPSDKQTA